LTAPRAFGYGLRMTKASRGGAAAGKPVEALSFEKALAAHTRGLELARFCQTRLEAAEQQVKVLEGEVLKPLKALAPDDGEDD
jgi:exodeoxyribonuclease VII small subunit